MAGIVSYPIGTRVRITDNAGASEPGWIGLTAVVTGTRGDRVGHVVVTPEEDRPDGHGRHEFIWPTASLEPILPDLTDRTAVEQWLAT